MRNKQPWVIVHGIVIAAAVAALLCAYLSCGEPEPTKVLPLPTPEERKAEFSVLVRTEYPSVPDEPCK